MDPTDDKDINELLKRLEMASEEELRVFMLANISELKAELADVPPEAELKRFAGYLAALTDTDPEKRSHAALMLRRPRKQPSDNPVLEAVAVPALRKALKDPDEEVRATAAYSLLTHDIQDPTVIRILTDRLRHPDAGIRSQTASNLEDVPLAKVLLTPLCEALKDSDAEVRMRAAAALKGIGVEAMSAVPVLMEALHDPSESVRETALGALASIAGQEEPVVQAITRALRDPVAQVRVHAGYELANLGQAAASAIPELIRALEDVDEDVRYRAAHALGEVGPGAKAAIPMLIKALEDESAAVRNSAAIALRNLGPDAKEAVPALKRLMEQPDSLRYATKALRKIEGT